MSEVQDFEVKTGDGILDITVETDGSIKGMLNIVPEDMTKGEVVAMQTGCAKGGERILAGGSGIKALAFMLSATATESIKKRGGKRVIVLLPEEGEPSVLKAEVKGGEELIALLEASIRGEAQAQGLALPPLPEGPEGQEGDDA